MVARITHHNDVAVVTLDTGNPMNALGLSTFGALRDIFLALQARDDVRAVILTGEGRAFCAGAALDGFLDGDDLKLTEAELRRIFNEELNPLLHTMMGFPKPIITAINGVAAGGGVGLALNGDIVIASDQARFYCGFIGMLALLPDVGVSWLLPNLMGRNKALPFALLGDPLTADEAAAAGMIYHTVPHDELMTRALAYADRLKRAPGDVIARARALFTDALSLSYGEVLERECEANTALSQQSGLKEGVQAFLEKRAPDFDAAAKRAETDNA